MKNILDDSNAVVIGNLPYEYPADWEHSTIISTLCKALATILDSNSEMPLADFVFPGDTVVIKPNLVKEENLAIKGEWESMVTHPSIIAMAAYIVAKHLNSKGKIIIADAPQTDSSMKKIFKNTGLLKYLDRLREIFPHIEFTFIDLRKEEWTQVNGTVVKRTKLQGDPLGYSTVNLGDKSLFYGKNNLDLYGADYDVLELRRHHNGTTHEYLLSNTILSADVIINLVKMKTHKKAGVTLALKNFIGINGDKNYLPHHTEGYPQNGGDEFPKETTKAQTEKLLVKLYRGIISKTPYPLNIPLCYFKGVGKQVFGNSTETIRAGNWWGNDTIWRTILDIHRAFFYCNSKGLIDEAIQRQRYLCITDGIIAGEGNGPMEPTPRKTGMLIVSRNPVVNDYVSATMMGFEPMKIPSISRAFDIKALPLVKFSPEGINITAYDYADGLNKVESCYLMQKFEPHFGWKVLM